MTAMLRDPRWRVVLALSVVTALSAVMLVGVSAWFLGAVALAGLGPMAYTFNFHFPAAAVRLLALVRTTGRYGERMTGHSAALGDQLDHRRRLFRRMAASEETRSGGWQLARADRLEAFLGEVEAVDFARLRAVLPALGLALTGGGLALGTLLVLPQALPAIALLALILFIGGRSLALRADAAAASADAGRRRTAERLGQQLAGIVSLEGGGERTARIGETLRLSRHAERQAARARGLLSVGDALAATFGPAAAALTILAAALFGGTGEALLPALLIAFAWLAFGELAIPAVRAGFAAKAKERAVLALSAFAAAPDEAAKPLGEAPVIALRAHRLFAPDGRLLAGTVTGTAAPGAPLALLGASGCGKTTFLKALAGWLPWQDGAHPLTSEAVARASAHLGLHDAAIIEGSVDDNLFSDAPEENKRAALDTVELWGRFAAAGGLSAHITQDSLSLGEARRLSLARALLTRAPVILLDEPGEHLGAAQAFRIMQRFLSEVRGKTVILVTHDDRLAGLASDVAHLETNSC